MTQSVPPPGHTATPVKQPNYLLRGVLAIAALAAFVVVAIALGTAHVSAPTTSCIVNGFGNKLCGDDARSYCELLESRDSLDISSSEACRATGWEPIF